MKNKRIISIVILLLMIFNTTTILAKADTNNPDYSAGYNVGLLLGLQNFDSNPPIYPYKALNDYLVSNKLDKISNLSYFISGFYDGYEVGLKGIEVKLNYVDILGTTLGEIYGTRDFQNSKSSNWAKALPPDSELRRMYNLDKENAVYRQTFLAEFKSKFAEGYLTAYEKANFDPKMITLQSGITDGEELGKILGSVYGPKDYYENKTIDFQRNLPTDRNITIDYSLSSDYPEYKEGFLTGFKRGYETEYNKTFREANINETLRDEKDAYNNGKALGLIGGEMQATNDYMEKKINNWKRSKPLSGQIIIEFNLSLQSKNYRQGFISGFYDGYSEGYNMIYQKFALEESIGKSTSKIIPISGGVLSSLDNIFTITIDKGTFYNPINLTIDTLNKNHYSLNKEYIKGSEAVRVSILNTSGNLDNEKDIELIFEYYGDKNKSGIYKLVNNKWVYLPSIVEDNFIKTTIKPNSLKSPCIYIVLLDNNLSTFHDIRGHWAKDEINTLIRRNIIYGYTDKTFKPDRSISRAEFLTLLSRIYNWQLPNDTNNTALFNDYSSFGARDKIISYAITKGYIKGYDDNTFRPNDPISYKEVEIVMGRLFNDANFRWYNTSAKMLYEKRVRSTSYDNMNNKINRGEVSYMLYILNEWRY